jgi:hypothetical protein
VSSQGSCRLWIKAAVLASAASVFVLAAHAQYPGQIAKPETDAPDLRAVAVFEWTGDEAHPKSARLVPICIYDGQDLNDAGIYLTHPEPLALESDVEYQLQKDGNPVGLFDIDTSAREQGGWVGYGKWRALPKAKAAPTQVAKIDAEDDAQSDVPILHRKHHAGDSGAEDSGGSGGSGSGANSSSSGPAPDPDRPTLHKGGDTSTASSGSAGSGGSNSGGSGQSNSSSGSGSNSGGDSNAPPSDPDRPVLRRTDDTGSSSGNGSGSGSGGDSSRDKLKKKSKDDDAGYVEDVASAADPNRPHLSYGKFAGYGAPVVPTLFGLPPDMQQTVAVSDATEHPEHPWNYIWPNPGDEDKMQSAMEDAARIALGLNPPPAPKQTPRTAAAHRATKPTTPTSALAPAPLLVEKFRVFELAYGSGATMVISAHTADAGANEKFVTLIAQPDLYGGVNVLVKSVTDAAHLDDAPRMRLVDAVEAEKDNRGELLFELRGTTERQFALYRVLRGDATRIFLSGPESIAVAAAN